MMLRVQLFQPLARDVRVNLRCRNIRMPEQQLHDSQVGAVVQQMRRKRMAQGMRGYRFGEPGLRRIAL